MTEARMKEILAEELGGIRQSIKDEIQKESADHLSTIAKKAESVDKIVKPLWFAVALIFGMGVWVAGQTYRLDNTERETGLIKQDVKDLAKEQKDLELKLSDELGKLNTSLGSINGKLDMALTQKERNQ